MVEQQIILRQNQYTNDNIDKTAQVALFEEHLNCKQEVEGLSSSNNFLKHGFLVFRKPHHDMSMMKSTLVLATKH